ncbi:carboxypeptidase regulatory-like domain-containing protein [Streptosporangium lutulentum]
MQTPGLAARGLAAPGMTAQDLTQGMAYAAEPQNGNGGSGIRGFIRDDNGTPVGHATLTLIDVGGHQIGRAVAQADGAYSLRTPGSGTYVLIASAGEHDPQVATLVVGDKPLNFDLMLTGSGKLTGTVRDVNGAPVAQAMVIVTDVRGEVVTTGVTGVNGAFAFSGVVAGTYTLAVSARPPSRGGAGRGRNRPDHAGRRTAARRPDPRHDPGQERGRPARRRPGHAARRGGQRRRHGDDRDGREYAFADLTGGQYTVIATGYPPVASTLSLTGQGDDGQDLWLGHSE